MDFFGNKIKKLLLILGIVSLFIWVVLPFLRGGQSTIQTAFMPINTQMEELLTQEANEKKEGMGKTSPVPAIKAAATPKTSSASTPLIESSKITSNSEEVSSSTVTRSTTSKSSVGTNAQTPSSSGTLTSSSVAVNPAPSSVNSTSSKAAHPSTEAHNGLLDLNTATLEQLDKLPGVGENKAKAILEYRSKKGHFKRVEELMEVKGIGEKMFEKLKGLLFVAPS